MDQSFSCGARYVFLDCGHKVIIHVSLPQHNQELRPLQFQSTGLAIAECSCLVSASGFPHPNQLHTDPSSPSWSIIFPLHSVFPWCQGFLAWSVMHRVFCVYLQPHADIYSSLPMAFITAKQASLCTEENYWHGCSATYLHTQLTYVQWVMSFCPHAIDWSNRRCFTKAIPALKCMQLYSAHLQPPRQAEPIRAAPQHASSFGIA